MDEHVTGYVTCDLQAVTLDAALRAILKPLGLSFTKDGGVYVVDPPIGTAPGIAASQTSPAVIPLSIASAKQAADTIRSLFPQATVHVDGGSNALIVTAAPSDLQSIRTVVQGLDVRDPSRPTTEAIELKLVSAPMLAERLRHAFPGATIAASTPRSLIIRATQLDMAQIKQLVTTLDSPAASPPPLQTASETVRVVQRSPHILAQAVAHQFRSLRVAVAGSSVVLTGTPDDVSKAKTLLTALDVPDYNTRLAQVFRVHNVDATSVSDLLRRSFPGVDFAVDASLNAISVTGTSAELQRVSDGIAQVDGTAASPGSPNAGPQAGMNGDFETVALQSISPPGQGGGTTAQDIAAAVTQAMQGSGSDVHITVLNSSSTLLLSGGEIGIRMAKKIIAAVDVVPKSVVLDTEIYEVDETGSKNLGLELPNPVLGTTYSEATPAPNASTGQIPSFTGLQQFTRTPLSLQVELGLLVQRGDAHVLANPRVTTLSGRTASIRSGDTIGILTTAGGGVGTVATSQLQTFQTGVTLDITPVVNNADDMIVSLHPVVSSLEGITNGVPQISTRDAQTTVHLKDDQTLIIGGLIEESSTRSVTSIPGLGALPLVGALFRNTQTSLTRNELVIVVTPHVINGSERDADIAPKLHAPAPQGLPTLPPDARIIFSPKAMTSPILASTPERRAIAAAMPVPPLPSASPTPSALATPTAFAQTNTFVFGSAPRSNYAASGDPVGIFYATVSPTLVRSGTAMSVSVVSTTNADHVTIGPPGFVTTLSTVGPGKWQATYTFNTLGMPVGQSAVQIPINATRSDGSQSTIMVPVTILP